MKKILIIGESASLSHIGRPFVIANALNQFDYEIHFACDNYFKHLLPDINLIYHPIFSQNPKIFSQNIKRGLPLYSEKVLARYIEEDIKLINQISPDIIIGDFRLSLSISARRCNIPYINIINAYWSPYHEKYFPLPTHPLTKLLGYKFANQLFQLIQPLVFKVHLRPINTLRKKYNLKPYKSLSEYYCDGDVTLYPDLEHLVPTHNKPKSHHYIGPIPFEPHCTLPIWMNELNNDLPNIYFTLGSSGDEGDLEAIIKVLKNTKANILYATVKNIDKSQLPSNFFTAHYLPGTEMCKISDLIITHGGMPSIYQALSCSIPIVALPSNMDHFKSMQAIENQKFGEIIRSDQRKKVNMYEIINKYLKETEMKLNISSFMSKQQTFDPLIIDEIIKDILIGRR